MKVLITNGTVLTFNSPQQVVKNGSVFIEGDLITTVGQTKDLVKDYASEADKIIDAKERVVMPGFICGHMHFYSAFATGMPITGNTKGFVKVLENLWWKLDKALLKDDIYYSALLGYVEALKSGTTTIIDHHASPSYIDGSLDEIEKAGREMGVRSNLCYEITNRNGTEDEVRGLKENERFIKKCHNAKDDLMSGLIGLHASFTVSESMMEETREAVQKLDSGIHVHVCEGKADLEHSLENYGCTVVERFDKHDVLNPKSILAHCIHLKDNDYDILVKKRPNAVHQPRSNMNNAVGSMNVFRFIKKGIPLGMGTDGMSGDMKAELLVGNLIHKHVQRDNTVGMMEVYEALLYENPKIVERVANVRTGVLASGRKADVIVTDYRPKTPIDANNAAGHVIFGVLNSGVATTIIDGRVRMEECFIPDFDERKVLHECQEKASQVWDRLDQ